ncbi:Transforming growth factor-beta, C-terminal domain-containing protein [Strongyloides ratti]|uniref:Transforming growth factor-beta, C-terminal domain-containing protein n=1 Tax=Strongyloides ratti TaxID=34506 RepID=A0A090KQ19_STRRB|nr:Transforming growth factor-beta, C-terminal domain-containing protein [Strongyloides ratti]CEF59479.1 Transforming growth factor-beta, C-terminal domain-containing protein [Strongyloides ratti]
MANYYIFFIFLNLLKFAFSLENGNGCDAKKDGKSCCRFSHFVNLHKIDPNIIAPHNINIGYCGGNCSLRDNITNNGLIRFAALKDLFVGCCHPKTFLPFEILKRDKFGITLEYHANLYTYNCRCG